MWNSPGGRNVFRGLNSLLSLLWKLDESGTSLPGTSVILANGLWSCLAQSEQSQWYPLNKKNLKNYHLLQEKQIFVNWTIFSVNILNNKTIEGCPSLLKLIKYTLNYLLWSSSEWLEFVFPVFGFGFGIFRDSDTFEFPNFKSKIKHMNKYKIPIYKKNKKWLNY